MQKYNTLNMPYEIWNISKKTAMASKGVVVAQEIEAARVGALMLEAGGNAVDAAIATAFALCVTEPWMSGLGGGGFMQVYMAETQTVQLIDFSMIAPAELVQSDYILTGETGDDLFGWPAVEHDTNFHGAKAISVPGAVAGYALANEVFGRKCWQQLIQPAVELAKRGHRKTWWTTLNVAAEAKLLALYSQSKLDWLPDGQVPTVSSTPNDDYLNLDKLALTLELLSIHGPEYFYLGELAENIVNDIGEAGGRLSRLDLKNYSARILDPLTVSRGSTVYNLVPEYSAGPTFLDALNRLPKFDKGTPAPEHHRSICEALIEAYKTRLDTMGHAADADDHSCTTHINTLDSEGNIVVMTTTLLSRFGSRFVLPTSGVLMNNGINWFDPRPNRPNSIAAGQRPLSNMCPIIAIKDGQPSSGLGASGGRKILPAVFQIAVYMNDFGMDLATAINYPRIDVSTTDVIVYDDRFDRQTRTLLDGLATTRPWAPTTFPSIYAVPSGVQITEDGKLVGVAHPLSPLAAAVEA